MSILSALIQPVTTLLDKFIEDKDQKNALAHEISVMADKHFQELAKAQLEVNKVEAAHPSLFVSGWRPAVGWVSCLGLFYNIILAQFLDIWYDVPEIESGLLTSVLMAMLGMGAMRSYEKTKNVARKN